MHALRKKDNEQYRQYPSPVFSNLKTHTSLYEPNTFVKQEGEIANSVFFIESGFLALSRNTSNGKRQIINFIFPGEYCGITHRKKYSFDIECLSFCSLTSINKEDFDLTLSENKTTMKEIYDQMVLWQDGLDELVFLLGTKSSFARTASFLIYLHIRQLRYLTEPLYKEIPLSRTDIGDFLGMRVETVSRTLTKLKEMNVIEYEENNRIKILNFKKLSEIAEMHSLTDRWEDESSNY